MRRKKTRTKSLSLVPKSGTIVRSDINTTVMETVIYNISIYIYIYNKRILYTIFGSILRKRLNTNIYITYVCNTFNCRYVNNEARINKKYILYTFSKQPVEAKVKKRERTYTYYRLCFHIPRIESRNKQILEIRNHCIKYLCNDPTQRTVCTYN